MTLSALLLFAGAVLVVAASPGPSIAALVARVISRGYRSVLPFLAAMWIGEAIWLCLAASGASYIAQSFHTVFVILKYCGVVYLLYLAWKMWTALAAVNEGNMPTEDSPWRLFLTGMAITLGNPKIMVLYRAILPSLIDLSGIAILGIVWNSARDMWHRMMDAVDPELYEEFKHIASHVDGVMDVHSTAIRWVGHRQRAEFHIIVNCQMPTCQSHAIAENVRHELFHALPALADIMVHVDPCECERCGDTHLTGHQLSPAAG